MSAISTTNIMQGREQVTLSEVNSILIKEEYRRDDSTRLILGVGSIATIVMGAMVCLMGVMAVLSLNGRLSSVFSAFCGLEFALGTTLLAIYIAYRHHTSVKLNAGQVKRLLGQVKASAEETRASYQNDNYVRAHNHAVYLKQRAERIQPDA
jgi:hypothetical protein